MIINLLGRELFKTSYNLRMALGDDAKCKPTQHLRPALPQTMFYHFHINQLYLTRVTRDSTSTEELVALKLKLCNRNKDTKNTYHQKERTANIYMNKTKTVKTILQL